jgi:hypothetical protein
MKEIPFSVTNSFHCGFFVLINNSFLPLFHFFISFSRRKKVLTKKNKNEFHIIKINFCRN